MLNRIVRTWWQPLRCDIGNRLAWYINRGAIYLLLIHTIRLQGADTDSLKQFKEDFRHCEEWIQRNKLDKALNCFESLRKQYPGEVKTFIRLAELHYRKRNLRQTLYYANRAIDLSPNEAYSPLTYLCHQMNHHGDHETALLIMNRLSVQELKPGQYKKVKQQQAQLSVRKNLYRESAGIELSNLGDSINTDEHEYLPSMSLDGQTLVFTRRVGGNEDFFTATRDSLGVWKTAVNMGYPPNTSMPDGAASLSADGYYLFYTRCDRQSPDGIVGGGCDLVFSYREEDTWSSPQYFGFTINTTGYEGQPCISSDNKDLYFVSNREGGYGGLDIWVSRFEHNYWSEPVNLGPQVNTAGNESAPFIHPDNETLYFASDGHPGLGQTDLFMCRRNRNGSWKTAVNMGSPLNTPGFDGSVIVNARGTEGICASERPDTRGGLDLYRFDIFPAIQPIPTICVKGFLTDKFYRSRLYDRRIRFLQTHDGTQVGELWSNEGDGSFAQALHRGQSYWLVVEEEGYRPYYRKLDLSSDSLPDNYRVQVRLRQPGFRDTLYQGIWQTDSSGMCLDTVSQMVLDSVFSHWDSWNMDPADIHVLLKSYYYSGDSLTDTLYGSELLRCSARIENVRDQLAARGIPCELIMEDMSMLIYTDERKWYRLLEIQVIESY